MAASTPYRIVTHRLGYRHIEPIPSRETLAAFYRDKYFQQDHGTYKKTYQPLDTRHRENRFRLRQAAIDVLPGASEGPHRFLDVGCGEGWALRWFSDRGWDVTGVDFSDNACRRHNAPLCDRVLSGEVDETLDTLAERQPGGFDLLWLDNVLEHSPEPAALVSQLGRLCSPGGLLMIEVPNDFSVTQQVALDKGLIEDTFWVCPPEHLNYFNLAGLENLAEACGWSVRDAFSDFPIDWFLLNDEANYIADRSRGRAAHVARVRLESAMTDIDPCETLAVYRHLCRLGMGRNITMLVTPAS
ncbi:class I SAM-dependent methyltransferase [Guyparkeria halophila]|uniref:Class I SAM-dependent methyltransferase n=1 Tax=Guyparkeria halophila TaxID=47960 RepID=A0ABZ0Z0X7_9GAMM|nr:class I SAM-dependent methyltransferase [Guyparkeria halophila]WQH17147.1 class I SAM-dependent methyltransferase [Guyparkeria halophila]